jgi:hypothetical protein
VAPATVRTPGLAAGYAGFRGDFSQGQPWTSTLPTLTLLRDFGIDPNAQPGRETVALVRENSRWEHAGQPFFAGEVEPCINGRTVAIGAYFGVDVDSIVARLLREQLADGGWNCETENGSVRASFATTICVLERLLEHERAASGSARAVAARRRGQEYLLDRRLFRRLSTGEVVDPAWLRFSFPTWWHYDVLRALDYFRAAGDPPDPRLAEAITLLRSKQQPNGTWLLEHTHPGAVHFSMEDGDGHPQSLEHAARTSGAALVRRHPLSAARPHSPRTARRRSSGLRRLGRVAEAAARTSPPR